MTPVIELCGSRTVRQPAGVLALAASRSARFKGFFGGAMKVKIAAALVISITLLAPSPWAAGPDDQGWEECWNGLASAFKNYDSAKHGTVTLEGPAAVERTGYGQWKFVYRAGTAELAPGGGIRIATRMLDGWGASQATKPNDPNYITALTSAGVPIKLRALERLDVVNEYFADYLPWQMVNGVEVLEKLEPGQTITITIGDQSAGSPGWRAPAVARDRAYFLPFVDVDGSGRYVPMASRPYVEILPGPAVKLSVVVPSQAVAGKPLRLLVRAEDDQGNVASSYRGTIKFSSNDPQASLPHTYAFSAQDKGLHWFEDVRFNQPGIIRVVTNDPASGFRSESNPLRCSLKPAETNLYWGDIHGHTIFEDGTGTPVQYFRYARDVAALDFAALTSHAELQNGVRWNYVQDVTSRFYQPHQFVTIYGYEWGGAPAVGGNHNVYYLKKGLPLFRSSGLITFSPLNPWVYYSASDIDTAHILGLFQRLKTLPGAQTGEVMVIPHWRGGISTPRWQDPELEPLIEMASEAGFHEAWAQSFIAPGIHKGFIGGSDDHLGRPGYGLMDTRFADLWAKPTKLSTPLAAVMVKEKTREAIFAGFFARHVYATSGARILLDVQADGHGMGEEYQTESAPVFKVLVVGTGPLKTVSIKRVFAKRYSWGEPVPAERDRGEEIYSHRLEVGQREAEFTFRYPGPSLTAYYYVLVVQEDGEQAVSSPILILAK